MSEHGAGEDESEGEGDSEGEREGPLGHDRRRRLLYCLHLYASPMKLADVAEQVLVWERENRPEDYLRERLYTYNDLYHEHLPVLREADLVEYDQRDDMVGLGPAAPEFEPVLERHLSAELGDLLHAEHSTFEEPSPGPFPVGLYRALAVPERRRALYYLLDRSRVSLDELADVLAGWRATDAGMVGPEERGRIRTVLERVHLPLLEDVGLVDYDPDAGTVALPPLTRSVRRVIGSAVPTGSERSLHTAGERTRDARDGPSPRE